MIAVNFANNLLKIQSELFNLAYKLTSDQNTANDLLQDTSLKALMNQEKYQDEINFTGWVYTIMRNIFINDYWKTTRSQTYVDQTDNMYFLNKGAQLEADSVEGSTDLKEIHRMVNSLSKEYRVVFNMYIAGYRYREIAHKLNLPIGTVKSRIFFTRQRLQRQLKDFI